jgi:PTH1 family peptidyl-tRNA hydrolase
MGGPGYIRVRVGVGRPPEGWETADYVLGKWNATEKDSLAAVVDKAADGVELFVSKGLETAMNRFNVRPGKGRKGSKPTAEQSPASAGGETL